MRMGRVARLPPRHCERSEAIHSAAEGRWIARRFAPRNDEETAGNSRFAHRAIQWQNYSQAKTKSRRKAAREDQCQFTGSAGRGRAVRGTRRAVAAADARREPARPSVPDLGAVRGAGAEMALRRISRARRRARRRPGQARRQARRIRADPSRQLHRGHAGMVCLRRARRHRGDHQHPLGGGRNGIFRRPLRRGRRHHPAGLCRTGLRAIAGACAGSR